MPRTKSNLSPIQKATQNKLREKQLLKEYENSYLFDPVEQVGEVGGPDKATREKNAAKLSRRIKLNKIRAHLSRKRNDQKEFQFHDSTPISGERELSEEAMRAKTRDRTDAQRGQIRFDDVLFASPGKVHTPIENMSARFDFVTQKNGEKVINVVDAFRTENARLKGHNIKDPIAILTNLYYYISAGRKLTYKNLGNEMRKIEELRNLQKSQRIQGMLKRKKLPLKSGFGTKGLVVKCDC